jgi:PAS domain S-box-containing protein
VTVSHPGRWTGREVDDLLSALDHLPAMIAYWDEDCLNRIANAAYVEWFGMSPAEIYGTHIRDLLGPEIYRMNLPYIRGALAGEAQLFNRTLVDTHGRTRYTQASYIPHTLGERVAGFFVLVTDISERVRAEDALAESIAESALLQERQRIAADMHDMVIQRLFAANLQLDSLAEDLEPAASQRVTSVIAQIDEAMSTLRGSINGLTRQMSPERFVDDIAQVLDNSAVGLGFAPTLVLDGAPDLISPAVRPELLAVLQEALSNVVRHASATAVDVTITSRAHEVRLMVTDDGCGIGEPQRSSGLANLRNRARRLGGFFSTADNDPHGTILDWRAPSGTRDSAAASTTVRQPPLPHRGRGAGPDQVAGASSPTGTSTSSRLPRGASGQAHSGS